MYEQHLCLLEECSNDADVLHIAHLIILNVTHVFNVRDKLLQFWTKRHETFLDYEEGIVRVTLSNQNCIGLTLFHLSSCHFYGHHHI